MSDVKIVRLQTGEDVISKVDEDTMKIMNSINLLLSFQLNQRQVNQYN